MRIAILTQQLKANYGGILQAFALQYTLKRMGHNPIVIEQEYLQKINIFKLLLEFPKRLFTKYVLKKRKYIFSEHKNNLHQKKRRKLTKPFIDKNIQQEYVTNYNSIDFNRFDAFIVGIDGRYYTTPRQRTLFGNVLRTNNDVDLVSKLSRFGTKVLQKMLKTVRKYKKAVKILRFSLLFVGGATQNRTGE